ncbi:similar to Saccharomyces cerevisiae YKR097W PCK1 Phosphoenolpyruvate carboxykinase [Maudiozyma barnettii]|uniref:Phosphoenolpyruvate carboxykinase (ATP) n=1 Tax=Maudiozyma barnettii TaxID=61262 RepID=A0A8H2ZJ04_9SACH|nr:phosphoenolpyruvate carboxykinase PCK1 [Kazachstania barnettii]CAB4256052.1 similar to Saccharomyces cerevisiae YKR097W PCK1 Phosphoenolpyruvate carboxykinase [Kazachstania barnettii]CAD1784660.1 similar to Saccharomyces cerevisiae YKR097W PCK1 Phosphoenolpyruvate carboxykinase [Kazachstania barnettii]
MSPSKVKVTSPSDPASVESKLREELGLSNDVTTIRRNAPPAILYEDGLHENKTAISSTGALIAYSGEKTGRSPRDKRIVEESTSKDEIWWGPVNKPCSERTWAINRERAADYLRTRDHLYIVDAYAGWDPKYRIKVRVICARAYHALFMTNMLIRPTKEELENFGEPDFTVWNAGQFPANKNTEDMTSKTTVEINFKAMEMIILGTEYAGEMKKGIFTVMFYLMPVHHNVLTLHSSANQGIQDGDVTLFFGLSGTGKTTLSADPHRLLIGDDEHCWSDNGVFNIEGGCYAKCIDLSAEKEPEIFNAIKFGSVLENIVYDPTTRVVDYEDKSITENTRCAYPIEYIPSAKIPCFADSHPKNIILLTCDASGVLPPISKLTPEQVMYHFISGYTSKMAGTEQGVTEPEPTFSSCFGQPFLALHPIRYATMLAEKMSKHNANAWLINTGWTGSSYVSGGKRCPLKYTRAILDSIHDGTLAQEQYETLPVFNLQVPTHVCDVPSELLNPMRNWAQGEAKYTSAVKNLASLFVENFHTYEDKATPDVLVAGPQF